MNNSNFESAQVNTRADSPTLRALRMQLRWDCWATCHWLGTVPGEALERYRQDLFRLESAEAQEALA